MTSVLWADRIVATRSSNGLRCTSAHSASGYSSARRRTTSVARARAPRGRAIARRYLDGAAEAVLSEGRAAERRYARPVVDIRVTDALTADERAEIRAVHDAAHSA